MELVVLGFVALIVIGPEKLPGHAREAARMLRNLRDMANGAKGQFRQELGPEFADLNLDALRELRALNPKSALMKVLFDGDSDVLGLKDDETDARARRYDPDGYDYDSGPDQAGYPNQIIASTGSASTGSMPASFPPASSAEAGTAASPQPTTSAQLPTAAQKPSAPRYDEDAT